MKSEILRINHDLTATKEKIKENTEKIKVNKTLPYLVSNVIEVRIVLILVKMVLKEYCSQKYFCWSCQKIRFSCQNCYWVLFDWHCFILINDGGNELFQFWIFILYLYFFSGKISYCNTCICMWKQFIFCLCSSCWTWNPRIVGRRMEPILISMLNGRASVLW